MNNREKILAWVVALLALFAGLVWGYRKLNGAFDQRRQQIANQKRILDQKEAAVDRSIHATKRLAEWEARSLPMDPKRRERARSLYQSWLIDTTREAGLANAKISAQSGTRRTSAYEAHTFTVSGRLNLPHLTNFLHRFYSSPLLHTIRNLRMRPIKDSKDLEISCTVEALSLVGAGPHRGLPTISLPRLACENVDEYYASIATRNFFAPPNRPPQLAVPSSIAGAKGRPLTFAAKATDPDKLDTITFALVENKLPGATIDPSSGDFRWTPENVGTFEVRIRAADDDLGSEHASKKVSLVIAEPKPVVVSASGGDAKPKKPAFDNAQFAFVSAITESQGIVECWISVRTTGELIKLRRGQSFTIGGFQGEIVRIGEQDIELKGDGKRWLVSLGETIGQAQELPPDGI